MTMRSTKELHDALIEMGADKIEHTRAQQKSLYDHLVNVSLLLKRAGEEEYVCVAGMFHSVYGTQYWEHVLHADREKIRELIGDKAERLVWLFENLDRGKWWEFYGHDKKPNREGELIDVSVQEEADLVGIIRCNEMEQKHK